MITYTQAKKGMSYYYDKRINCPNGNDTLPLPIWNRKALGGVIFGFYLIIKYYSCYDIYNKMNKN